MPITKVVVGDLLESGHSYIAHHCNCNTVKSHGLSASIATKFPSADIYSRRKRIGRRNATSEPSTPGTVEVIEQSSPLGGIEKDSQHIICLLAQWAPGKCGNFSRFYPDTYQDTQDNRELWFKKCLDEIDRLGFDEIAMPYLIGCGLAGGNWKRYEKLLNDSKTNIVLYKYAKGINDGQL